MKEIENAIEAFEWLEKFMIGDVATLKNNKRDQGQWIRCMAKVRKALQERQGHVPTMHCLKTLGEIPVEIVESARKLERWFLEKGIDNWRIGGVKSATDTIAVKREDVPEGLETNIANIRGSVDLGPFLQPDLGAILAAASLLIESEKS